jgi:hypothetical protein
MLRLLIGSGVLLMVLGFGAAGWQYWRGMPAADAGALAAGAGVEPGDSVWLTASSGVAVPEADTLAFLATDRLVPGRRAVITRTARLTELLADGESLPAPAFLAVFADIRAPLLAEGLCPALTAALAADCRVQAARLVDGSLDPATGAARFRIELAFRPKPDGATLPDLAAHVLESADIPWPAAPGAEATVDPAALGARPIEADLAALAGAAMAACAEGERGPPCRTLDLALDWAPGRAASGSARIAWLAPLPRGMEVLPPLVVEP